MRQRQACFWATPCGRGCSIKANYQSTTVHLPPALASGDLDIVPNAMTREVTMDAAAKPVWEMTVSHSNLYRANRIPSLYPGVQWQ